MSAPKISKNGLDQTTAQDAIAALYDLYSWAHHAPSCTGRSTSCTCGVSKARAKAHVVLVALRAEEKANGVMEKYTL